jgi:hypothetical protein
VACLLEPRQQLVQEHQLATAQYQPLHPAAVARVARVPVLRALKQERVVAALLQLDDHVQQGQLPAALGAAVEVLEVALEDPLVVPARICGVAMMSIIYLAWKFAAC